VNGPRVADPGRRRGGDHGRVKTAALVIVCVLLSGFTTPASAETVARIDYGAPVNLRSGPGTQYALTGRAADGAVVTIVCGARTQAVAGKRGTSVVWDRLGDGQWVADAYVLGGAAEPCPSRAVTADVDDYPYRATPDVVDRWAMYSGQCTSWVAWRMEQVNGYFHNNMWREGVAGHWGNADKWDDNARSLGYVVDRTPVVGAIAQWEPDDRGAAKLGHVAYIAAVDGENVTVQEYNWSVPLGYDTRTVSMGRISNVIHL
jgi:surface antigen